MLSETLTSVDLVMNTLVHVAMELNQVVSWVFKIKPWSLGSDIQAAQWVRSPAVVASVPKVVGVLVSHMLPNVVAFSVHLSFVLENLRPLVVHKVVISDVACRIYWNKA